MLLIRFGLIRRSIHNEKWTKRYISKLLNTSQMQFRRDYSCKFAGKYSDETFRYCYTSSVNSLSISKSEENVSKSISELLAKIKHISDLPDDELLNTISQLRDVYFRKDESSSDDFKCIAVAIDDECARRALKWDFAVILQALENFYPKAKSLCPHFMLCLIKKKYKKALKSPAPIMLKYLKNMNFYKFWGKYYCNWYLIEFTLMKRFEELNVEEISVLLSSLINFKGKLTSEDSVNKILNKLIVNIENTDNKTLSTYLNFFIDQLMGKPKYSISLEPLLNILSERISNLDITMAGKVALILFYERRYDFQLLDKIAEKLINELPNVRRVIPIEEIISTLVFYNYNSRDVHQKLIDSFKMEPLQTIMADHPKRLIKLIGKMCLLGIYPYEHINLILSKEFLRKTFGKRLGPYTVSKEIMIMNGGIQIECPDYKGNLLNKDLQECLHNHWSSHLHDCFDANFTTKSNKEFSATGEKHNELSLYNKVLLEARTILQSIFGNPKFLHTCYILPFLPKPNLVYFSDTQKNPTEIPDIILCSIRLTSQEILKIEENLERYAILPASQHPILKGDNYMLTGQDIAKVRMLKKLNFNPIIIVVEMWFALNENERRDYLCKLIR